MRREQCQAERERNFRIGMAAKCIDRKTGLLHNEKVLTLSCYAASLCLWL